MKYRADQFIRVVHALDPASYAAAAEAFTDGVDCKGYREALVVIQCGAFTATGDVEFDVEESADDSTYADVTDATTGELVQADDQTTYMIRLDLTKRKRYIRVGYDVDDDACIFGITVLLTDPIIRPATASATLSASV